VKLLRVLQDRTYEVLGSSTTRSLDVRVVSATNRDLRAAVQAGAFREDLLYRINLITVHLPSLADRRQDIPLLARHFLHEVARGYGRPDASISDPALAWLARLDWPGNVRQLRQLVERTVLMTDGARIEAADLQRTLLMDRAGDEGPALPSVGSMTLDEIEKAMILKSLEHHGGNLSRVAASLGMSRAALYRRLERYGIRS
jgi:two-component system NtrC family response regulator